MHKVSPDLFSERDFDYAQAYAQELIKPSVVGTAPETDILKTPEIYMFHEKLWERAKKEFNSPTLLPSWGYISITKGPQTATRENSYDSACTYGIMVPIYQTFGWDISIEEHVHSLSENEGLFYSANDHSTKRGEFLNPETNVVVYGHFFFVEPDHWWFTEEDAEKYLWEVIRGFKP